jgi:hypothetical protein
VKREIVKKVVRDHHQVARVEAVSDGRYELLVKLREVVVRSLKERLLETANVLRPQPELR